MNCIICNESKTKLAIKDYPGYIQDTFFDIFYCPSCNTSFMDTSKYDKDIYDKIYQLANKNPESIIGYDRYIKYAKEIKSEKDPFLYLLEKENTYYPIFTFLKSKKNLKVLEVGCGMGYLTYCIHSLGHNVIGTDISDEAIKHAQENFGDLFLTCDILNYKDFEPNSFDLIIGTELIEHLPNIPEFIEKCRSLLKKEGSMIFTTPNKKAYESSSFWFTDNPPVHTCWLSDSSFSLLSRDFNLKLDFLDNRNPYYRQNLLIPYLYTKFYKSFRPIPREGVGSATENNKYSIVKLIQSISDLPGFYYISNLIYYSLNFEDQTLSILLTRKDN
jgi:2-polyprenyl-3-methyl-5-hydroxy-6-metoxy-1,4-benzoquinol methylase